LERSTLTSKSGEAVAAPLSEEHPRDLVARNLAEIEAVVNEPPEAVKHELARHIDRLMMKIVEMPDGTRYDMTAEIRLFASGDPDDVLLGGFFQRGSKQYKSLSFPLKAILNPLGSSVWRGGRRRGCELDGRFCAAMGAQF
jgi:hypothetical protein